MNILSKLCCITITIVPLITFAQTEQPLEGTYKTVGGNAPYFFTADSEYPMPLIAGSDGTFHILYTGLPVTLTVQDSSGCYCKFIVTGDFSSGSIASITVKQPVQQCRSGTPKCAVGGETSGDSHGITPALSMELP